MELNNKIRSELITNALKARESAYAPYSGFYVGACLMTVDGEYYDGCNIENASYGACNCAERTAVFKAVSDGKRDFCAIAIAGGMKKEIITDYAYPCGICRQVFKEFCKDDFVIIVCKDTKDYKEYTLKDLLPFGFGGENLQ